MKRQAGVMAKLIGPFRWLRGFMLRHKLISIGLVACCLVMLAGAVALWRQGLIDASLASTNQPEAVEAEPELAEPENNIDELARLKVSEEALENTDPVSSVSGQCDGTSIYSVNEDSFSVASRLADGSWRCTTYNLKNLQNYRSDDGKDSIQVNTDDSGKKTVVVESTDETGSRTKTTTVTNPDGSGYSTTEGGYSKMIIGPTNDGRQIYGFFDMWDNRYYEDVGRFQTCFLTQNFYDYGDNMSYFDGTYRELSAAEKATQAASGSCEDLPKVQYEPASYDLPLLKKCIRKGVNAEAFDTATCYRQASGVEVD